MIDGLHQDSFIYRNAFQHSLIGMSFFTLDGRCKEVNISFCNLLGYSADELCIMTIQDIFHPQDLAVSMDCMQNLLLGKVWPCQLEKRCLHKFGHTIWVQVSLVLIRNKQGDPLYFSIQMQDITARKKEQTKLKRIERPYKIISQHAQDVIYYATPDAVCQYISPAVKELLGYEPDEIVGKQGHHLWHPDDLQQYLAIRNLNVGVTSSRILHKQGYYLWFEIQIKTVRNECDETELIVGVARDISERKRAERLLKESEQRHKSLLKYTPVGIVSVNIEGNYTEINPAFLQMTGYSAEELLSLNFRELISPDYLSEVEVHFSKSLKRDYCFEGVPLRLKDGTEIIIMAWSSPIIINDEVFGVYIICKDITEQKQTEELLQKSEKLSMVGELAAGIAHEIRNPLTSLRGFVQLEQSEDKENKNKLRHKVMLAEIDRINEIVSELLVLAKPSNETVQLSSVAEKLDHVITLFEGQAHLHNIVIQKDIEQPLPLTYCQGSIKQVFINILKNAFESMPHGGQVLVQVKQIVGQVYIRFVDQGCGIPQEQLAKVGNPFFTTKQSGTGLGLMVSQRIIQNHNGVLRIESEVGKGTLVEILLPITTSPLTETRYR